MYFVKPDIATLESESDVEQKFLYPLLVGHSPSGLGFDPAQIRMQRNLRKFSIGKGSDQKSYFPDYLIVRGNVPLLVVEGKKPGADVEEAFREARLYACELNAIYPSGINPVSRLVATNANRLIAGYYDQARPILDISYDEIDLYSSKMSEFIKSFGSDCLLKHYLALLPSIRPSRYWKPLKLVGGFAKQKEQVPVNSFGVTLTADFSHLFNPQSRAERSFIARHAYISSKRRQRYIEPIDKIIRAASPPSQTNSKTLEDTSKPVEIIKPFRDIRALEHKVMLLIGSAGAGKSTFVDYLQEIALPADVRAHTLWIRIDMNPAPISRDEIYAWLREEIIEGCRRSDPKADFASLELLKAVHSVEVNEFRKGVGRLYEKTPGLFESKLADLLTEINRNRHKVASNLTKYCSNIKRSLLIVVLDNSDKRLREEQLLMFEAAQWLQREFRGLILLPLREETYDNHRNEPPLDTAIKDLVFRIEPPLFQYILASRVNLALRELAKNGDKILRYDLPNGFRVEYPASDQGFYLSSILRSIFDHDLLVRRLIVGLSGKNMRRALEIFLDFCTSGHIGTDEITKIRLSEGMHVLSLELVMKVLLRANQRFYESDDSYLKNVFSADILDKRPHFFARLLILKLLQHASNLPGSGSMKSYVRVAKLRTDVASFGVEQDIFTRELQYLARAYCVLSEDFRQSNFTDDDLISIAPAGHVHLTNYSEQYYLSAIAEETWFEDEQRARRIAERISDTRKHYSASTTLENAEEVLTELEIHKARELARYNAIFDDDDLSRIIDLSQARTKLTRFETQIVQEAWVGANLRFPVGSLHGGRVTGSAEFGLFVEIGFNVIGLIHSSKLPSDFRTRGYFQKGNLLKIRIVSIDRVERRAELDLITQ